jgi:hypothetical protein
MPLPLVNGRADLSPQFITVVKRKPRHRRLNVESKHSMEERNVKSSTAGD